MASFIAFGGPGKRSAARPIPTDTSIACSPLGIKSAMQPQFRSHLAAQHAVQQGVANGGSSSQMERYST
jgi:hypothetical protein